LIFDTVSASCTIVIS
jgi:hypothetical protein